jgi:hypothetical protein
MFVPQFEMHPFLKGGAVPGLPVGPVSAVQNKGVMPHCPQISQQEFRGQGLSADRVSAVILDGVVVFGATGPQTEFGMTAGIGCVPVLRHMTLPASKLPQPNQPQVILSLKVLRSLIFNPLDAAIAEQVSIF